MRMNIERQKRGKNMSKSVKSANPKNDGIVVENKNKAEAKA
jgi:hypothetical protein